MKVLVVSFDRVLAENLRKALSEHEVYTAKNSEEAIKMIPPDVEGVIYDAISGAISEEDINTLYTKKFSNARYVILYDELFPIDESNIIVSQKLLVPRDTPPQEIVRKLIGFTEAQEAQIEHTTLTPPKETPEAVEKTPQENKVLIVSFDQALIDNLRTYLGQEYELITAKTVKQAMERGRDAKLVLFDAISGVVAERGLLEMSQDPDFAPKPFIILVDDLFPVNTDNIPLEKKTSISRDTDPTRIKEIVEKEITETPPPAPMEEITADVEEEIEVEAPEDVSQSIEDVVKELEESGQEVEEKEEEEMPALETLGSVVEEVRKGEETPPVDLEKVIDEEMQKIRELVLESVRDSLPEAVREEVRRVFEEMDVKGIVREVIRQVVKEKIDELIS